MTDKKTARGPWPVSVKVEDRKLREQLLGVRLIAQEMAEEVETVRHHVLLSGADDAADASETVAALARLDELLEPLLKGRTS